MTAIKQKPVPNFFGSIPQVHPSTSRWRKLGQPKSGWQRRWTFLIKTYQLKLWFSIDMTPKRYWYLHIKRWFWLIILGGWCNLTSFHIHPCGENANYLYSCMYLHIDIHSHIYIYIHVHMRCQYIYEYIQIFICIYIYFCIYTCIYTLFARISCRYRLCNSSYTYTYVLTYLLNVALFLECKVS